MILFLPGPISKNGKRCSILGKWLLAKQRELCAQQSKPLQPMKKTITFFSFLLFTLYSFAQTIDTTQTPSFFRGQITATNNGISLIPNFSLNKPAALFDLSIGKGRLSFDPMFRFGLDGKPWTLIFWFRYKVVDQRRFTLGIGAHPPFCSELRRHSLLE